MEANLGDIFRVYSELANKKKKLPIHRKKKKKKKKQRAASLEGLEMVLRNAETMLGEFEPL